MLMNTTFLGDSFSIKWQSRGGSMADKNAVFLTRHIGKTTYKVRVYLSETAEETMEDKILRLIRNDGLANQPECGIMELPQMSRPSERSA